MKTLFLTIIIIAFSACSSMKNKKTIEIPEELKNYPILTVIKIEAKKEGYKAHLVDDGKMTYTMLVSKSTLKDNYISLKIDDTLKAKGNYAESIPVIIYVEKIYKLN